MRARTGTDCKGSVTRLDLKGRGAAALQAATIYSAMRSGRVANPLQDSIRFPTCSRSTIEPATVRTLWQQFRAFLARRIRYKITRGGVLFTFAILLVAAGAIVSANNLIFLILAAMMATLLVSGLVSRLCLAGLALDFQVPEHI